MLILPAALFLALLRSLPGPVFFPIRALAIVYADLFRGIPTILVITMLGLGMPALGLSWMPTSQMFWAIVALVLVYTAYVSEVYRAGIESVHPSQAAAARSLGLTHGQSTWYVIVPQAVRRVIPPLLNDFIGLQKDTALVGTLGVVEAFRQAQIDQAATFNGTYYLVAATLFVAITIPLARFTDWLVAHDRRRQQAGGSYDGSTGASSKACTSPSTSSRYCAASTSRSASTRSSASSAPPDPASRRCCAASTSWSRSRRAASLWAARRSPHAASTSTRFAGGSGSSSSPSTCSRT